MYFPKEFMDLTLCKQRVAWGTTFWNANETFTQWTKFSCSHFERKINPLHVTCKHAQMVHISGRSQFTDHNL